MGSPSANPMNHPSVYSLKRRYRYLTVSLILLTVFMLAGIPADRIQAAAGIKLYNYTTKKETNYTDKQLKVTYNGKKISSNNTPGILMNGIALVPYNNIFANSDISAECVYNKSTGAISISKFGKTISMTIGSKKAYVNGKAVTLPIAPVKIKFVNKNIAKVMVPSRFICETLGYGYTWNSSTSTVAIVKTSNINSLSLSYDSGKRFDYTGTQGFVTIDGKNISLGNMPSIINNNTAMLRAKRVFADSTIKAEYSYDKKSNTVTLAKDGKVLVMTIGSKTAYLNGTAVTLDRAPMLIYNYDVKASFVMVPGNNTANLLGYDYTWNKTTSTSVITTKKINNEPGKPQGNDNTSPELGDSGYNDTGLLLKEWSAPVDIYGKSLEQYALNQGIATAGDNGMIYLVNRDYTNIKQNAETYMIVATTPFEKVTSGKSGQKINIIAHNKQCIDNTYQIYGNTGNYVNNIITTSHSSEFYTAIDLNILPENYSYDITLSEDKLIMFVTVYINGLTRISMGTNDSGDYLTLTGLDTLKVNISEQNGMLTIDLPYTVNGIGDQNIPITGAKNLNLFYAVSYPEKTQLLLGMNSGTKYHVSQEGNRYTVTFGTGSAAEQPLPTEDTVVPDKSIYEIIIPKPAGITRSQLSDQDDYFNNRFSIKLPGDYTSLISKNSIISNSGVIKDISVFLNNSNETEIQITTTKLQGYEYVTDQDNIYINIGNPRDIYPNIVVLDPGHGGPANGAQYFGSKEKDFNLTILYEIGKKYFNSDPSRLKVYYTRETDVDLTLKERAAYASKLGADLFVSLHMNASTASGAYGTEVYYSNSNNKPNGAGLTSKTLASIMVNNLCSGLGTLNRGAKAEKYTVVHNNTVPAILIELGFLSNKNDYAKLSDPVFRENTVKIIYETLLQVFEQYPTGR